MRLPVVAPRSGNSRVGTRDCRSRRKDEENITEPSNPIKGEKIW